MMGNPYNGFSWEERQAAYNWWKAEVAAGRREKPTACDACGQTEGRIEPHDEDYSLPYGPHICEFGLCYRCHMMIHCRFKATRAWDAYRLAVRSGKCATPIRSNDFGVIRGQCWGGREPKYTQHEPPARLLLDEIHSGKWLNRGKPAEPPAPEPSLFPQ